MGNHKLDQWRHGNCYRVACLHTHLSNSLFLAQVPQIVHLCGEGVLKPFCDLLAAKDDKTVGVVLDGVSNILATAEKLSEVDKVTFKWCYFAKLPFYQT